MMSIWATNRHTETHNVLLYHIPSPSTSPSLPLLIPSVSTPYSNVSPAMQLTVITGIGLYSLADYFVSLSSLSVSINVHYFCTLAGNAYMTCYANKDHVIQLREGVKGWVREKRIEEGVFTPPFCSVSLFLSQVDVEHSAEQQGRDAQPRHNEAVPKVTSGGQRRVAQNLRSVKRVDERGREHCQPWKRGEGDS